MLESEPKLASRTTLALIALGTLLGFLVGVSALSGDAQGRVNLLFLLLVFAFLPALSLVMSCLLAALKIDGITAAILHSPLWPKQSQFLHSQIGTRKSQQLWLFFQAQVFSLAFAFGSILIFLLLLLGTDINFVWRSTLLEATDLQPILSFIAAPWFYWQEAQPSLALLEQSQNSRILGEPSAFSENWWQFVLAAQLSYNLLPRTFFLLYAIWRYHRETQSAFDPKPIQASSLGTLKENETKPILSNIVYTLQNRYSLYDCSNAPEHCLRFVTRSFGKSLNHTQLSALDTFTIDSGIEAIVVLVKSWDAPLAELKDLLVSSNSDVDKYLLPMDWNDKSITLPLSVHLEEWQRFAATLPNWKILQPGEHS